MWWLMPEIPNLNRLQREILKAKDQSAGPSGHSESRLRAHGALTGRVKKDLEWRQSFTTGFTEVHKSFIDSSAAVFVDIDLASLQCQYYRISV